MKRATTGVVLITVLAVPIAVATEWVTKKEAEQKAAEKVSDTALLQTDVEYQTEAIRIFPSF